jgi:hypothetical protein
VQQAANGLRADFQEWPLLEDESPFLPRANRPLETILSLLDI